MIKNLEKYISFVSTANGRLFNDKHSGLWNDIQKYYSGVNFYFYHENSFDEKQGAEAIDFYKLEMPDTHYEFDLFKIFPFMAHFLETSEFNTCYTYGEVGCDPATHPIDYWRRHSIYWFRKAPAMYHAASICTTPILIFLDADCNLTPVDIHHPLESPKTKDIDKSYVETVLDCDVASLNREFRGWPTETGHIAFNLWKRGGEIIEGILDYYISGKVFKLDRWDDCVVFDAVCKELDIKNGDLWPFANVVTHHKGKLYKKRDTHKGI